MSENNKEDFSHLGIKIENMLDEIIKSDDELDNNPMRNSLKFSDDNSYSEEAKENTNDLFDKYIFSNAFSPFEEQNKNKQNSLNINQNLESININQPISNNLNNNINYIYNNNQYYFNHLFTPNINNNINNNSYNFIQPEYNMNLNINQNLFINNNKIINNYYSKRKNSESINSISISTNNDKNTKPSDNMSFISIDNNFYNCNSFINYQNFDNSFFRENIPNKFKRSRKNNNSFFAGDKIIFNNQNVINQNNNPKHNRINKNVEIEILLIEINKILIKLEKISIYIIN